ncbi:MSC_0882 family membrane protein [Metamycoplasma equirhinis]|uniref:MSC_0882 family membrane protein n=1 Tax=Metamycoplasma equirhinis TaxID=92402 RepID=UPI003593EE60
MKIRPIFSGQEEINNVQTATISSHMQAETIATSTINKKVKTLDPDGIIPNGIYKVFKYEKNIKRAVIIFDAIITAMSIICIILFACVPQSFNFNKVANFKLPWGWYIVPILLATLTLVNLIIETIEYLGIKKSVIAYRESIRSGTSTTPPFIALLYRKLIVKQARRTWAVIAVIFYVGLFALTLWGLKDKVWGKLNFKAWIHNAFPGENGANIVLYALCGIMIVVLVLFIVNTILRKKRMVDIQSFFGTEVMNYSELAEKKSATHRFYAKIFFLSVLIILVLPIIVYLILKKTVWKGK